MRSSPATDGVEALEKIASEMRPDLMLLDIMMPKLDGIETVKPLKGDRSLPFIPVIMVTAKADSKDVIAGLESGGDDYLVKPVDPALSARVRAMLRIKALHDTVQLQAQRLEAQAGELAAWSRTLEARVEEQIQEIERIGRLESWTLSPQIAETLIFAGGEAILESHRRDIVVLFCDMRGFTAFSEMAEPEEVMAVLREYHGALSAVI